MNKRILALLLAVVMLCSLLVGCKEKEEPTPSPPPVEETLIVPQIPENAIDPFSPQAGYACVTAEDAENGDATPDQLAGFVLGVAENEGVPFNLACNIEDGVVSGLLPSGVDRSALIPTVFYSGKEVRYNDQPLISGQTVMDLTEEATLTLVEESGAEHTVTVNVQNLYTGLPSVAVTVEDYGFIASKTEFVNCTLYVGGGDSRACPYATDTPVLTTAQIRGRGNTSWNQEKKGYSINLENSTALLDMPAARKWALVANYEDKSLLRNYVANYLSAEAGLESVLEIRPVDMWYNGVYWGTYNLCERISIHEARVNITEQEDVSALEPSEVAYLFEFDGHVNEVEDRQKRQWQRVGSYSYYDPVTDETFMPVVLGNKWVTVKEPGHDQLTPQMANYVYGNIHQTCVALKKGDWETINEKIDVLSFVRWYIVEEYMNNADSSMHSSVFMYWDVNGKMTMGPTWDFDRSSDNCDYWNAKNDPDSLYESGAGWFKYLFQCKEARALLKSEWAAFSEKIATIDETVNGYADMLSVSQQYNFRRWDILSKHVGSNPKKVVRANTYEKQVEILTNFLVDRRGDLDKFIQGLS